MKLLIINNAEPADRAYNEPLHAFFARYAATDFAEYRQASGLMQGDHGYDGVIISGAPLNYANDTAVRRLPHFQWTMDAEVPILGVCMAHQIIGRLYGSQIIEDTEAEQGPQPLLILRDDPILQDMAEGHEIFASHRVSVTLPEGFVQLASTALCRNQVMKHADRDLYGVQFHPEMSEEGTLLLHNFVTNIAGRTKATGSAITLPPEAALPSEDKIIA